MLSGVVFSDVGLAVVAAAAGIGAGYLITRAIHSRRSPFAQLRNNLTTVACDVESDLTRLQLDDCYGVISQGWNRLLEELAEARHALEGYQLTEQVHQTLERYQLNWVRHLLHEMPYGLLILADDLSVEFSNKAARQLLGKDEDELAGQRVNDLIDESLACLASTGAAMIDRTFELSSPPVSLRVTSLRHDDAQGGDQIAVFLRDVSQEMQGEQARDQFLYHITHELRTPLTNIRAYAETLSGGVLDDPDALRECYNVIVGETQRLSRLVEDLLSVSQLEVGSARLDMNEVNIARLLRQVVEDMQASADEKNIELILALPSKVATVLGDKDRLAVVLTNLVGNAVKYTPSGGRVEVNCAEDGARVQIRVVDTGPGVAPEEQERIFEKFYRSADERVAQLPGTGLGLAIARQTVQAHGGTIELESEPGKGSIFIVWLNAGKASAVTR
ncbi:MAG TPA: ATP-binding protein [Phycisphaerae bacterium]|nr:ATP-binding protein [Phycisphaerae bacterium]